MRVLDLACGHGDLANRLAARGCRVTGLDSSEIFLDRARADAAAVDVSVDPPARGRANDPPQRTSSPDVLRQAVVRLPRVTRLAARCGIHRGGRTR
ncbi:methyltransferase domain-containing protein [Amycolatopsis pigmentata]|uniref:Methyltransferase domain-containing protein n=1 Tax=Amycolatopsis pigmentata TaxID=450801 RepID=A0ABW5FW20_9PSEU